MISSFIKHVRNASLCFFTFLVVGCGSGNGIGHNSNEFNSAKATITDIFKTEDIEFIRGISTGSEHGTHPYIEVVLSNSPVINNDSSYDFNKAFSAIALTVFEAIKLDDNDPALTIDITIEQNINNQKRQYSTSLKYEMVKRAGYGYLLVDSIFSLWAKGSYEKAYDLFSPEFKDTFNYQVFQGLLNKMEKDFGPVKSFEYNGVRLEDRVLFNKEYNVGIIETIVLRNEKYKMQFFFNLNSEEYKILAVNM